MGEDTEFKNYQYQIRDSGKVIELKQSELTLGQMQALIQVFSDLELTIDSSNPVASLSQLSLSKLFNALQKKNGILNFFKAILIGVEKYKDAELLEMPYKAQREILQNFFSFNATLISDLGDLFLGINSNVRASAKAGRSGSQRSSTSSAKAISDVKAKSKK